MSDWVKFHRAIMRGAKRSIPRAVRFVFMEICVEARELDGVIELRADVDPAEALVDLLGGDAGEVREALGKLTAAGMVRVDRKTDCAYLVIPSWPAWNRPDTSTDRVKKHREKLRNVPGATTETHVARQDETHETFQGVSSCNDVNALEESRVEKRREDPPPPPRNRIAPLAADHPVAVVVVGAGVFAEEDPLRVAGSAEALMVRSARPPDERMEALGYAIDAVVRALGSPEGIGGGKVAKYLGRTLGGILAPGGLEAERKAREPPPERERFASGQRPSVGTDAAHELKLALELQATTARQRGSGGPLAIGELLPRFAANEGKP